MIDACALKPDLDILDKGDKTLIGEKVFSFTHGRAEVKLT